MPIISSASYNLCGVRKGATKSVLLMWLKTRQNLIFDRSFLAFHSLIDMRVVSAKWHIQTVALGSVPEKDGSFRFYLGMRIPCVIQIFICAYITSSSCYIKVRDS